MSAAKRPERTPRRKTSAGVAAYHSIALDGPVAAELRAALGPAEPLWDELVAHVETTFPPVTREWKRTGKDGAWFLRLRRKDRTIL